LFILKPKREKYAKGRWVGVYVYVDAVMDEKKGERIRRHLMNSAKCLYETSRNSRKSKEIRGNLAALME